MPRELITGTVTVVRKGPCSEVPFSFVLTKQKKTTKKTVNSKVYSYVNVDRGLGWPDSQSFRKEEIQNCVFIRKNKSFSDERPKKIVRIVFFFSYFDQNGTLREMC